MIVHLSDKPAICLDCVQVIHLLWSRDLKGTGGEWLRRNLEGANGCVVKQRIAVFEIYQCRASRLSLVRGQGSSRRSRGELLWIRGNSMIKSSALRYLGQAYQPVPPRSTATEPQFRSETPRKPASIRTATDTL